MTRVFRIGSTTIVEDETMRDRSIEEVQALLRPAHPEVAHATIRTRQDGETTVVEFLPQPGRKG